MWARSFSDEENIFSHVVHFSLYVSSRVHIDSEDILKINFVCPLKSSKGLLSRKVYTQILFSASLENDFFYFPDPAWIVSSASVITACLDFNIPGLWMSYLYSHSKILH